MHECSHVCRAEPMTILPVNPSQTNLIDINPLLNTPLRQTPACFFQKIHIDFQKNNFTRQQGGDNTRRISPTDNAVKLIVWKSIDRFFMIPEFNTIIKTHLKNYNDVSVMVSEIKKDGKGLPVLLQHYLKLNARLVVFNVNNNFSDVVDGLILVDLKQTELRMIRRFMGDEGVRLFEMEKTA